VLVGRALSALSIPVVLFVFGGIAAWWAKARVALRFQLFVVGVALVGAVSLGRVTGGVFDYLVRWWWLIAALGATSIAYSFVCGARRLLGDHRRAYDLSRVAAVALAAVLVIVASFGTAKGVSGRAPVDDWTPALEQITPAVSAGVSTDRPVYLQADGPLAGWVGDAMSARLVADGVDVRVPDEGINLNKFGELRLVPGPDPSMNGLWVVTGDRIDDFRDAGVGTELAFYDPLSPEDRAASDELEAQLRATYAAAGRDDLIGAIDEAGSLWSDTPVPGLDRDILDRYEAYRTHGVRVAVFLTDDATTPPPP
jgi:hypothetical protein